MKSAPEPDSTWGSAPAERFNWRDLFRVLGLALDVGKWKVGLLPAVVGVFACLASFVFAASFPEWWPALNDHSLISDSLSFLLMFAGAAILYLCVALAVSGVTYQVRGEVLDGRHRSFSDVLEFWGRHLGTLIRVPAWLMVIIGALLAVPFVITLLLWLIAKIDVSWIQSAATFLWALSLLMAVPLALLAAITLLVLLLGTFIYPAIVGIKEEEAFDVVHDLFDLVKNRGPLLVLCLALSVVFMAVTSALFVVGLNSAIGLGVWLFGERALSLLHESQGPAFFEFLAGSIHELIDWAIPYTWHPHETAWGWQFESWHPQEGGITAPGMALLLVLFLFVLGILGYLVALYASGCAMTYLVMADPFDIEDVVLRERAKQEGDAVYAPATEADEALAAAPPETAADDSYERGEQEQPVGAAVATLAKKKASKRTTKKAAKSVTATKKATKKTAKKATKKTAKKKTA